jgi:hypothetical protein
MLDDPTHPTSSTANRCCRPQAVRQVLDRVRQLQPTRTFSSYLLAASGMSLEAFLEVLEGVPDAEPFLSRGSHQVGRMIVAMAECDAPAHRSRDR